MIPNQLSVTGGELVEDRFSRLRLIPWWDQEKIAETRVLVVGAGALGNEILKNLALLGFQKIVVVDLDRIEESNLSRTVLFRTENIGSYKAEVAAKSLRSVAPEIQVQPLVANVLYACGLGLFAWSDVILAGLDNREARLWINRSAWKVNRPWIDGAIEGINGLARVFLPGSPPCYECTLGEVDWQMLQKRMSCNLLAHENNTEGKIPTTPTISSIIAGIQVQEAVKLIHGLDTLAGRCLIFEGLNHTSYVVEYTENPECMSHYTVSETVALSERSSEITLQELLVRARTALDTPEVSIEFSRDVIQKLSCPHCGSEEECFVPVGSVSVDAGRCPKDGQLRTVMTAHSYSGTEDYGSRTLDELGLPLFDLFVARSAEREIAYLVSGDQPDVLGVLAKGRG
jgi:molybdopterin/thiamine biosynthesis adenylyltransferase